MEGRTSAAQDRRRILIVLLVAGLAALALILIFADRGELASPGARRTVDSYLRAAEDGDGQWMYALLASSERLRVDPATLASAARLSYSRDPEWDVLKAAEQDGAAEVVVQFKRADVEANPYRFILAREAGEWRILQAPELRSRAPLPKPASEETRQEP
jgi:hypothetical protein